MTELKPLSKKHQKFVNEYLRLWNGTRAYMATYPDASYETALANASKLLGSASISSVINARLHEAHMSADEALKLQSDIARGDIGELADDNGFFDFGKAKEAGLTKLIKKFKQKTTIYIAKKESDEDREVNELEVELYPADAAQERLLKIHGKFTERVDVTTGGKPLESVDNERFDRAILSLADAVRESISNKRTGSEGKVDAPK